MAMKNTKFRAWDGFRITTGRMFFSNSTGEFDGNDVIIMHSTGLLDKNGKEIFEGDIVERDGVNWEVRYQYDRFTLLRGDHEIGDGNAQDDPIYIVWEEVKVIGNIYENSTLL